MAAMFGSNGGAGWMRGRITILFPGTCHTNKAETPFKNNGDTLNICLNFFEKGNFVEYDISTTHRFTFLVAGC